ncbi:MAG: BatA and WFA domain-containing protein [Clostridia bacterium]|nr:BatA and WFA domain-containing protein [Clostridia bacterium]
MSFLYPLGLLGLIGIPILIAIYIIKNKYTEQVISSTYIWTLSERFLKKRLPINKLVGIISLILQIIAVLLISVAVAHPVFFINGAANDYCFVIDGSGSMNITCGETTRFEAAKEEIRTIIKDSENGSAFSLVFVGENTDLVFKDVDDKDRALRLLNAVEQGYSAGEYTDAIGVAQGIFNENPSTLTYLFTDREVDNPENVTVINVADKQVNYAVSSTEYTFDKIGKKLTVNGSVISYESSALLNVEVYIDGASTPAETLEIEADKGEEKPFTVERVTSSFSTARIVITNTDALPLDNEAVIYNADYENSYKVLFVSDSPFFIHASLLSIGKADVRHVYTNKYESREWVGNGWEDKDIDLYIFDDFTPKELPNAAVWFFNPTGSVAKSGFTAQEREQPFDEKVEMAYNTYSSTTLVETLLKDVNKKDVISVINYKECSFYRGFTTLLSHNGFPLLFAGVNENGNRQVVFAFDLEDTNMPLQMNFDVLMKNLLEYTFPTVVETTSGFCGDTMRVNVIANCDSIRVVAPISGRVSYLNTSGTVGEFVLTEVGTYTVVLTMNDKTNRYFNIFSALPEEERSPVNEAVSFSLSGEASDERRDGIYDDLLAVFIVLSLVFLADWMVYCYEQYQLR